MAKNKEVVSCVNRERDKATIYNAFISASDDELASAANSHLRSTTVVKDPKTKENVTYHNAIGAFYTGISNVEELRKEIITPIIEAGPTMPRCQFVNHKDGTFRVMFREGKPAIRNSIYGDIANKAHGVNALIYFYSKKECGLLTLGQTHAGNANVTHKHRRELFLDVSNIISTIEYVKKNKLTECLVPLMSFARELMELALSDADDSPSDYDRVHTTIAVGRNINFEDDRLHIVSIFPTFRFVSDGLLKLKNLITHHERLAKILSPNDYLK